MKPNLERYYDLLGVAEQELKDVQTAMIRERFKGNDKDRVARALRNVRIARASLNQLIHRANYD